MDTRLLLGLGFAAIIAFDIWRSIVARRKGREPVSGRIASVIRMSIISAAIVGSMLVDGQDLKSVLLVLLALAAAITFHLLVIDPFLRGGRGS